MLPDSKRTEVSLQPWIDRKRTGRRVHASYEHAVRNVLQRQFLSVVPAIDQT